MFKKINALKETSKTAAVEFNKTPTVTKEIERQALCYARNKVPFVLSKPKAIVAGTAFSTTIYEGNAMIISGDLITIVGFVTGLSLAILALKSIVRDYHLVLGQRTIHQDDYLLHTAQIQQQEK